LREDSNRRSDVFCPCLGRKTSEVWPAAPATFVSKAFLLWYFYDQRRVK